MPESEEITRGIRVRVESRYIPERSDPAEKRWFFVYHVTIANTGEETVQLISRHWIITDADGKVEEVKGPGVVGKQPWIGPGQSFEYTSFCPLTTSFGSMEGTYHMVTSDGAAFDARIAPFALSEPFAIN